MAAYSNTFEGGTNGAVISPANSGGASGDSFDGVNIGSGATLTYDSTTSFHGSLAMRLETTTNGALAYAAHAVTAATRTTARFYVRLPVIPASLTSIFNFRTPTGYSAVVSVNASGQLIVLDTNLSEVIAVRSSTALAASTWYRVEIGLTPGTTATNGSVDCAYYTGDSTTALSNLSATGCNFGSAQPFQYRLGRSPASTFTGVVYYDDIAVQDSAVGYLGPSSVTSTQHNYEKIWTGTAWQQSREDEYIWTGSIWK